jgi:hypothetical protein
MEEQILLPPDMSLNKAFEVILTIGSLSDISTEVAHLTISDYTMPLISE